MTIGIGCLTPSQNARSFCIKLLAVPPKVESDHSSPPFSSSLPLRLPIIDSVHIQHWALATALLPLPFPFPASSLSLLPSSHRFCLCSTLGSSDRPSPPSFSFPRLLSPAVATYHRFGLRPTLGYRTTLSLHLLSPAWLSSIRSLSKSGPQIRSSVSQHSLNRVHRLTGLGFGPTLLDVSPFAEVCACFFFSVVCHASCLFAAHQT